jgi:Na+/H+ antiporter NhaD/arsenite permease-like protein
MILASELAMDFNDFFWYTGANGASYPGIFWAVQVGGIAGFVVLWLMFRKHREPVVALEKETPLSWFPTVLMGVMIVGLALASLVDQSFIWFGGALCVVLGVAAIAWFLKADREDAVRCLRDYDFSTTFFLMGIFMLVYALEKTGAIESAATWAGGIVGNSMVGAFILIVLFSVVFSAFVDNVPYLAAMLPLVGKLSEGLGADVYEQPVLAFGLLLGACLGGNVTPVGASANIVAYGMLNEDENVFPFVEFVKIGLPFTVAAVAAGATFLWFIY